jgi:opacity protein-like surface antigen
MKDKKRIYLLSALLLLCATPALAATINSKQWTSIGDTGYNPYSKGLLAGVVNKGNVASIRVDRCIFNSSGGCSEGIEYLTVKNVKPEVVFCTRFPSTTTSYSFYGKITSAKGALRARVVRCTPS